MTAYRAIRIEVPVDDHVHDVELQLHAPVVHVDCRRTDVPDVVDVWLVEGGYRPEQIGARRGTRRFLVTGTGQWTYDGPGVGRLVHRGTVLTPQTMHRGELVPRGELVWHVWELLGTDHDPAHRP